MVVLELGLFAASSAIGAWAHVASARADARLQLLHRAAASGHNHVITELVEAGLLVDATAEDGMTALAIAAAHGQAAAVQHLLLLGAQASTPNCVDGTLATHVAAAHGDVIVLSRILEADSRCAVAQDKRGYTPLHHACMHGHASLAEVLLISFGVEANARAADDGCTPLALATRAGSSACVRLLLEHGGEAGAADHKGDTPLHLACAAGDAEIVEMLLEFGASMYLTNRVGTAAIDTAMASEALAPLVARYDAARLRAGERDANSARLVRSRLHDQLQALRRTDPVGLSQLCNEAEVRTLLRRYGIDVDVAAAPTHSRADVARADAAPELLPSASAPCSPLTASAGPGGTG